MLRSGDTGTRGRRRCRGRAIAPAAPGSNPASSANEAAVAPAVAPAEADPAAVPAIAGIPQEAEPDSDLAGPGLEEAVAPPVSRIGRASWEWLDSIVLHEEFATPFQPLRDVPRFQAPGVRRAFVFALRAPLHPAPQAGITSERAWKLFLLVPRMLLGRPDQSGATGRATLLQRVTDFEAGRWTPLLRPARPSAQQRPPTSSPQPDRTRERACAQVRRGQLSRARQSLTSAPLAPGNAETLRQLTDPARRPPAPRQPLSDEMASFQPAEPVRLTPAALGEALRTAKRGTAAGLSGAAIEHYRLLLEDGDALDMLSQAATQLANADVPESVLRALALSRLTALAKPAGGVRGIATGDTLRRLVSRTLARQFADVFDRATRPYQFALQARAGTDCLAAMLRAATELDADATVVSLDGRCAYDTVSRAAFLSKLREVAPSLVPYVRAWYGGISTYVWWDADGQRHDVLQGEGCEQGDALAPALFALAQHDALHEAQGGLQAGEFLAAFLDDLYLVTTPPRARAALDDVTRIVEARAGVSANLGKTRVYRAAGGPPPPGIEELGPGVWCGTADPANHGFVALGVPIGSTAFVQRRLEERLQGEQTLLQELQQLPDLQCAWLLLLYCASPRAQHALRTVPPSESNLYAAAHDEAIWRTLQHLLAEPDAEGEGWDAARSLAFLPTVLGGLGLCCAERVRTAAYWAAWADALPVMRQRRPDAAARCARELSAADAAAAPSLRAAAAAGAALEEEGWTERPDWSNLLEGAPPPAPALDEPAETGDWLRGWQRPAARILNTSYCERLLSGLPADARALLRSQSGAYAGEWLRAIPADAGSMLAPPEMLIALRRRLRLPLPLAAARCGGGGEPGCGANVDALGDHRAACARSGLLARRAPILERAWVRVAREAVGAEGRVVPQQWLLHTTAPGIPADDRRRLDFVLYGATRRGEALCCDVTLVSPLRADGRPQPGSRDRDGAAIEVARRRKLARYPELARPGPQRLVVLACEVGGRWGSEAHDLLRRLVRVRSLRAPPALRTAAMAGWRRRWWGFLSCAQQRALASTLLGGTWRAPAQPGSDGQPTLSEVVELAEPTLPSLLPLRAV